MISKPAQMLAAARDERARRKAAWVAQGKGLSDHARWDEIIWSNIEHRAARAADDPAALARSPNYWVHEDLVIMAKSARATFVKALARWPICDDLAIKAKLLGLRDLTHALERACIETAVNARLVDCPGERFAANG